MGTYRIDVLRGNTDGTLTFTSGSTHVSTTCWWDIQKKIPAGRYKGCSATIMRTKQKEGIYIPDVPGYREIFIHMGRNASWSKGCIVIPEEKMLAIYNSIVPKNAPVVTVVIEG